MQIFSVNGKVKCERSDDGERVINKGEPYPREGRYIWNGWASGGFIYRGVHLFHNRRKEKRVDAYTGEVVRLVCGS